MKNKQLRISSGAEPELKMDNYFFASDIFLNY